MHSSIEECFFNIYTDSPIAFLTCITMLKWTVANTYWSIKDGYNAMIKRLFAVTVLLLMIGFVIYSFTKENTAAEKKEELPVEVEDESFDGVIWATPEDNRAIEVSSVKVQDIAPDFTLETLSGESLTLSDLKGKKVFLNFWATWCTYCIDEMPAMQQFYEDHKDELVVLGLNATGSEKSVKEVKSFVEDLGVTFPIALDKDLDVTYNKYQAFGLPTTYFINTKGEVQLPKHVGPMDIKLMTEKLKELE